MKAYLESILFNVLSNAIKYRSTSRDLLISVKTETTLTGVVIKIKDNGIGIPANGLAKIFEPYMRFNVETEGRGLGFIYGEGAGRGNERNRRSSSEEGKGTEFCILLPKE